MQKDMNFIVVRPKCAYIHRLPFISPFILNYKYNALVQVLKSDFSRVSALKIVRHCCSKAHVFIESNYEKWW